MGRKADIAVKGLTCPDCGRKNSGVIGVNDWTCEGCGERHDAHLERPAYKAFSGIAKNVGEWKPQAETYGACYDSLTPEIFFADETPKENEYYAYQQALVAMRLCNECPIQQACLKYATTDQDAIKYGIWGGTFAFERLKIGTRKSSNSHAYQRRLRKRLIAEHGLTCPPIPDKVVKEKKQRIPHNYDKRVRILHEQGLTPIEIRRTLKCSMAQVEQGLARLSQA